MLWRADDECPAQAAVALPAHLDRLWFLEAGLVWLNLAAPALLNAAVGESS